MTINWISETDEPGTISMSGPGLGKSAKQSSEPAYLDLMEYTQAELDEQIAGLEQGSWLKSNSNYKHSVTFEDLKPGKTYNYTVTQSGETHSAAFKTAPKGDAWKNVRIIAFSDSETEPRGRTEHREWELSPVNGYTADSLQRPGAGSAWDQEFGMTTRYGQLTLRYPLDQSTAFNENLKHIPAADPDLVRDPAAFSPEMLEGGRCQQVIAAQDSLG